MTISIMMPGKDYDPSRRTARGALSLSLSWGKRLSMVSRHEKRTKSKSKDSQNKREANVKTRKNIKKKTDEGGGGDEWEKRTELDSEKTKDTVKMQDISLPPHTKNSREGQRALIMAWLTLICFPLLLSSLSVHLILDLLFSVQSSNRCSLKNTRKAFSL